MVPKVLYEIKYALIAPWRQGCQGRKNLKNFFYDELSTSGVRVTELTFSTMIPSASVSLLPAYTGRPLLLYNTLL